MKIAMKSQLRKPLVVAILGLTLSTSLLSAGSAHAKHGHRQQPTGDRHNIANPYIDPSQWLRTMQRTRVAELFRTQAGLRGHVQQIQQEVNRLTTDANRRRNLEGKTGNQVVQYTRAVSKLRQSLISSAKAARFDFPKFGIRLSPLGSDLYLERRNGKLLVDGRAI